MRCCRCSGGMNSSGSFAGGGLQGNGTNWFRCQCILPVREELRILVSSGLSGTSFSKLGLQLETPGLFNIAHFNLHFYRRLRCSIGFGPLF
mmetsp:Transcript_69938/g.166989  ORF Transcript_69938/g.166989 Transcript_69938/m.166989 type:complete len:91 (+) Transcript_69938:907-1179(+)